ncbi:MAG: DegT/DnrJ/EryC1/StrS family aminotransferase [Bacteroidales bacterium]|nr:DegT/DnrJ/EryC1/StrS family aminotransferase [Bacteroidales bacterium]
MKNSKLKDELLLTKPSKPPMDEFQVYLDRIWGSRWLTNNGPLHEEFEKKLCDYLGVKYISLFANGSLALMIALKALDLTGEIITTPFTSIETAQSIYWNQLQAVFVDINESDLNINIAEIEKAITPKTSAILPVHIFGNPCHVEAMEELARKYNLKVLYDAAHCFGVEINGRSVCDFGDLSVLSFHATKVFNTMEGGAIISHDKETKVFIDALKNSGKEPGYKFAGYGFNAKMNDLQSAFGLVQLKYIDGFIDHRKSAVIKYRELLKNVNGLRFMEELENVKYNYSYFPIIIDPEEFGATRDELLFHLENRNIKTRKYFHPLVTDFPEFKIFKKGDLSIAKKIADNILCLPLFHELNIDEQVAVTESIIEIQKLKGSRFNSDH